MASQLYQNARDLHANIKQSQLVVLAAIYLTPPRHSSAPQMLRTPHLHQAHSHRCLWISRTHCANSS